MKKNFGKHQHGQGSRKPFAIGTANNPNLIIESVARGRLGFTPERVDYELESARLKEESRKLSSPRPDENAQQKHIETFEDFSNRILQTTTNMFDPAINAAMIALSQGRAPIVPASIHHEALKKKKDGENYKMSTRKDSLDYKPETNPKSPSSSRSPKATITSVDNYELNTGRDAREKEQSFVATFGSNPTSSQDDIIWKSAIKSQLMLNNDIDMVRKKSSRRFSNRGLITKSSMLRRDDLLDSPPVPSDVSSKVFPSVDSKEEVQEVFKQGSSPPSKYTANKSRRTLPIFEKYQSLRNFAVTNGFPFNDETTMKRALHIGEYSSKQPLNKNPLEDEEAKTEMRPGNQNKPSPQENNLNEDLFVSKFVNVNVQGTKKKVRFGKSSKNRAYDVESIKMPNLTAEQEFWKNMKPPFSARKVKSLKSIKTNATAGTSNDPKEMQNIFKAPTKPKRQLSVMSTVDPLESIMDFQGSHQQPHPTTPFLKEMKTRRLRQLKTKVNVENIINSIYSQFNIQR